MNNKKTKIPCIGIKIISSLTKLDDRSSLKGDLEEVYLRLRNEKGAIYARLWFWMQVFHSLPQILGYSMSRSCGMFNNYLKTSFRNIRRNKIYSLINLSSLTIGLAGCVLMLLWVQDELGYDGYHKNADNIFRIIKKTTNPNGVSLEAFTPVPLGPSLEASFPEVINSTRFFNLEEGGWLLKNEDRSFDNDRLGTADPSVFEMLDFKFVSGDPNTVFNDIYSMVITQDLAFKYFGDEDPLGKSIIVHRRPFKITGIIENIPGNSHLQFDFIFPMSFWADAWGMDLNNWKDTGWYNFIQLRDGTDVYEFTEKIKNFIKDNDPELNSEIFLQPIKRIHLEPQYAQGFMGISDMKYVYIFSTTAILILLIACINFMNLATARSARRAQEIGMRKVAGAFRSNLIMQFIGESLLFAAIAAIIAAVVSFVTIPVLNQLSGKDLDPGGLTEPAALTGFVLITIITGIIAGSYPALMLSACNPVKVLKGGSVRSGSRGTSFRKALVTVQFTFTIILIIGSLVIFRQMDYINNKDIGFKRDNILSFIGRLNLGRDFRNIRNEFLQFPGIINVSKSIRPVGLGQGTSDVNWEGKSSEEEIQFYFSNVDEFYLETFGIELIEGRYFSGEMISDTANYVLNQKAVSMMGMVSPIGKKFSYQGRDGTIIGIMKDYHLGSLHTEVVPVFHRISQTVFPLINVKYDPQNIEATIGFLEDTWKKYVKDYPFTYTFLDDQIDKFYISDRLTGEVFKYFTLFAIFISCLGLYGMASYTVELKTKEIGVRKVLGASVQSLVMCISKEFIILLSAAVAISIPAAWLLSTKWLENFAYRTEIGIEVYIYSIVAAASIVFTAVSFQAGKAAGINPVDSLKYE